MRKVNVRACCCLGVEGFGGHSKVGRSVKGYEVEEEWVKMKIQCLRDGERWLETLFAIGSIYKNDEPREQPFLKSLQQSRQLPHMVSCWR